MTVYWPILTKYMTEQLHSIVSEMCGNYTEDVLKQQIWILNLSLKSNWTVQKGKKNRKTSEKNCA